MGWGGAGEGEEEIHKPLTCPLFFAVLLQLGNASSHHNFPHPCGDCSVLSQSCGACPAHLPASITGSHLAWPADPSQSSMAALSSTHLPLFSPRSALPEPLGPQPSFMVLAMLLANNCSSSSTQLVPPPKSLTECSHPSATVMHEVPSPC